MARGSRWQQCKEEEAGSLRNLIHLLIHFVRGFYDSGVGLVGSLALNEIDKLFDYIDIRLFAVPLRKLPRPSVPPGVPTCGSPDASVAVKRVFPTLFKPAGFSKLAAGSGPLSAWPSDSEA